MWVLLTSTLTASLRLPASWECSRNKRPTNSAKCSVRFSSQAVVRETRREKIRWLAKPSMVAFKIDPPEVIAGSDEVRITVMGTDFVEGSTVFLNDSAQPTTFESVTQLSAQVAKETIANPGVLKLTVVNPDLSKSTPVDC